jgi:hypothetical protein
VELELEDAVDYTHQHFGEIFLGGIPGLLNRDGAYLSFICVFAGIEALAGFRHPDRKNGERLRDFVTEYFDSRYHPVAERLWELRNSMVHSFSPRHFALIHHGSMHHFRTDPQGQVMLNAEDMYASLVAATDRYFAHLRSDSGLQGLFAKRLSDPDGGGLAVRPY